MLIDSGFVDGRVPQLIRDSHLEFVVADAVLGSVRVFLQYMGMQAPPAGAHQSLTTIAENVASVDIPGVVDRFRAAIDQWLGWAKEDSIKYAIAFHVTNGDISAALHCCEKPSLLKICWHTVSGPWNHGNIQVRFSAVCFD